MNRPLKLVHPPPRPPKDTFGGDDLALVEGFRQGDPRARAALYDRYADHVHRVLYRLLGGGCDLADLHHDVFVRALGSIGNLTDPTALKGWLTMIAVHVARSWIDQKRRRSWLWFLPHDELPEVESTAAGSDVLDALRTTYAVLDGMPADERIAFALRYIDGMELTEVATACNTSLATIKRRLARAGARFEEEVRKHPVLEQWVKGGDRWAFPTEI